MAEGPENGKELSHSAHANGMNESTQLYGFTHKTAMMSLGVVLLDIRLWLWNAQALSAVI
jgi:hypothetical protein